MSASSLSKMERKVVRLVALGCSVKRAAEILGRSVHTIDNHKTRAMRKLGVHNAVELTRHAIRFGISPLDDQLTPLELGVDQPHAATHGPHIAPAAEVPQQRIQRIEVSHEAGEGKLHPHAPRHDVRHEMRPEAASWRYDSGE